MKHYYSAWVEIDLKAIRHNYREIKRLAHKQYVQSLPRGKSSGKNPPQILAVIKADAYGHGMMKVASVLSRLGVVFLGVSDVAEGILLRKHGIKKPIVLLESPLPSLVGQIVDYRLTPTVCTLRMASALNACVQSAHRKIDIHIKIDTGMGRLGVWHEDAKDFINQIRRFSYLSIKGIYTHFPVADIHPDFTRKQVRQLYDLVNHLDKQAVVIPCVHAANSMGIAGYKHFFNVVRPGLMLYGLYPSSRLKRKITLHPVMSVKTRVIFIKRVRKGSGISYGRTFIAPRDMTVATLSIGYSDGYLRCLSNKAGVLIQGKRCPVVGRVTMDQIMVDVSRLKSVKLGTEATVLGTQKKACICADELAAQADTINYEIVCSLGTRLPKVYSS